MQFSVKPDSLYDFLPPVVKSFRKDFYISLSRHFDLNSLFLPYQASLVRRSWFLRSLRRSRTAKAEASSIKGKRPYGLPCHPDRSPAPIRREPMLNWCGAKRRDLAMAMNNPPLHPHTPSSTHLHIQASSTHHFAFYKHFTKDEPELWYPIGKDNFRRS
jgi:hypothetical protein